MIQRRDYQQQAVEAIRAAWNAGETDVLVTAATGTGKTAIFLSLLHDCMIEKPGSRALVIAHRKELIDQPVDRLIQYYPNVWDWDVGVVMAERDQFDKRIVIATVQTLASSDRMQRVLSAGAFDYLVIDEAHHATAESYVAVWQALKNANPALCHVGVTATPIRADGDGLAKVYKREVFHYGIREAVQDGNLVNIRWLAIQTKVSVKDVTSSGGDFVAKRLASVMEVDNVFELVVESHRKYAGDRQALAFTVSVEGAERLAEKFCDAGIAARAVSAGTPSADRAAALRDYHNQKVQVLCNVGIYTEGVDVPSASCVHQVRPTKSDGLYVQMIGRALRLHPGKEDALVLDYCPKEKRNVTMAGDVLGVPLKRETMVRDSEEEGDVVGGFTFDGRFTYLAGDPADIVSRQLDYLNLSPWSWYRHEDGSMSLDLGRGSDDWERVFYITPADDNGQHVLFGVFRSSFVDGAGNKKSGDWHSKVLRQGVFAELQDFAEASADKYGNTTLGNKTRSWRSQPATDKQIAFARRIKGAFRPGASRGELAQRITHGLARRVLVQARFLEV